MGALIDLSSLTMSSLEAEKSSEAIFEKLYANPELKSAHEIRTGIEMDTRIPIFGQFGLLAKASSGCSITESDEQIAPSEKSWTPKLIEFRLEHCQYDIDQQFKLWKRAKIAADTWEDVDSEMMAFFADRAIGAALNETFRISSFGDTVATLASSGGLLTAGTTLAYFTMLDGLWKQIYTAETATDITPIEISENSEASYVAQLSLGDTVTLDAMREMYETIDPRAFDYPDLTFQMTRSLNNNWRALLEDKSLANAVLSDVEGKSQRLDYRGVPIVIRYDWDRNIRTYEDNATVYNKPHRLILAPLGNIPIGTSDEESMSRLNPFYVPKERTHYIDVAWKLDIKLLLEDIISVAY